MSDIPMADISDIQQEKLTEKMSLETINLEASNEKMSLETSNVGQCLPLNVGQCLPLKKFYCIEFPGYFESKEKLNSFLGMMESDPSNNTALDHNTAALDHNTVNNPNNTCAALDPSNRLPPLYNLGFNNQQPQPPLNQQQDKKFKSVAALKELKSAFVQNGHVNIYPSFDAQHAIQYHPITGNIVPTFNLLIKVKKITTTFKTRPDGSRKPPQVRLVHQLVGFVYKTCRFRMLADFQSIVQPQEEDKVALFMDAVKSLDVEKLLDFEMQSVNDLAGGDLTQGIPPPGLGLWPSPSLSRLDYPAEFGYRENPYLSTIVSKDPTTGKETVKVVSRFKSKKVGIVVSVTDEDAVYPTEPPHELPDLSDPSCIPPDAFGGELPSRIIELVEKLKSAFQERPIYSRLAISNYLRLRTGNEDKIVYRALPYVAFLCSSGPWRGSWVKYGIDPRLDNKYRVYQSLDLRSLLAKRKERVIKTISSAVPASVSTPALTQSEQEWKSHVFDGSLYTPARIFALIDITDPKFKSMIHSIIHVRPECEVKRDGWYLEGHISKIRDALKLANADLKSAYLGTTGGGGAVTGLDGEGQEDDGRNDELDALDELFNQDSDDYFDILEEDD